MQLDTADAPTYDDDFPEPLELTLEPSSADSSTPTSTTTTTSAPSTLAENPSPTPPILALFNAVSACADLHPDAISQPSSPSSSRASNDIVFDSTIEDLSDLPGAAHGSNDGGLPPPFPGSGGWITAENVGQFFNEDGEFVGGGRGLMGEAEAEGDVVQVLGEGAGRVRGREETDGQGVNGDGSVDEGKWRRTE